MAFIRSESTGMPLADHGIEQFLCNIYALLEVQGVRKGSQPRCTTPEVSSGSIIYLCMSIYHNGDGGVPSSAVHADTNVQEWVRLTDPTEGDKAMWRS